MSERRGRSASDTAEGPGGPQDQISSREARRIAISAQRLDQARTGEPATRRAIGQLVDEIGLLQLDTINVFCRSHYMPIFSRLGPYDRADLDAMAAHSTSTERRDLFEYWAHEASLMSVRLQPFLRWRMTRADKEAWKPVVAFAREQPKFVRNTLELVTENGPIRASAVGTRRDPRRAAEMWNWHEGKLALEYLFYSGQVAIAGRTNFERLYDLTERVLPAEILEAPTPPEPEAQRELIRFAAKALGVATEPDLRDYFRLTSKDSKQRVAELVDAGELLPVAVEGWQPVAYLPNGANQAAPAPSQSGGSLLSPFDSLIWSRDRTERLFDFQYTVEIYTPAARRRFGYYVLPFLLGDELVARVDLKADRKLGELHVLSAFAEEDSRDKRVAVALAAELLTAAEWLDLTQVTVADRGNLAATLASAIQKPPTG